MSVVASDDFNRADNADVGAVWTPGIASLRITSNAAVFSTGNDADSSETHTTTLAVNHWAEAVIKTPGANGVGQGYGVIVRATSGASSSFYRAVGNSSGWDLALFVGGAFSSSLASGSSPTFANGDTIYLEAQGNSLVLKKGTTNGAGGTTVTTISDPTLPSNTLAGIGYSSSGGGGGVDAFVTGDFSGGAAPGYAEQGSRRNRPGRGPYSLGNYFRPRLDAFSALADVTAALSGQAIATSLGTLTPSTSAALAGSAITVSQGTVGPPVLSLAASGQAITAIADTLAPALSLALTGGTATFSQGTVSPSIGVTVELTGQSIASTAGTLAPAMTLPLTGAVATFAQGTVTTGSDVSRALSGQSVGLAQGNVAPSATAALAGSAVASAQGTVTPVTGISVALTGSSITSAQGSMSIAISLALTGDVFQALPGNVGVLADGDVLPPESRTIRVRAEQRR